MSTIFKGKSGIVASSCDLAHSVTNENLQAYYEAYKTRDNNTFRRNTPRDRFSA